MYLQINERVVGNFSLLGVRGLERQGAGPSMEKHNNQLPSPRAHADPVRKKLRCDQGAMGILYTSVHRPTSSQITFNCSDKKFFLGPSN